MAGRGDTGRAPHHARRRAATAGRRALCAALAIVLAAPLAAAQPADGYTPAASGNPYSQVGIPAEATAENGVLARERALAAGRRTAWERMAAELGVTGAPAISDGQLESLVSSIVIEQERVTPTRYSGRITVNFRQARVRSILGARAVAVPGGSGGPASDQPARPTGPASTWVDAVATYRSMEEWLELQRRLRGADAVATVQVRAIAIDRAVLRLGLRMPGPVAADELAGRGVAISASGGAPDASWRVGLAGGG